MCVVTGQPGDKLPTDVTYDDFQAEYAKTGMSKCRSCQDKIDKVLKQEIICVMTARRRCKNVFHTRFVVVLSKTCCTCHIFRGDLASVEKGSEQQEGASLRPAGLVVPRRLLHPQEERTRLLHQHGAREVPVSLLLFGEEKFVGCLCGNLFACWVALQDSRF